MTEFATDEKKTAKQLARQKADKSVNDIVILQLMANQAGRRWVWLRLAECHIFTQIAHFGEDAVRRTYFAAGERNVGLRLLADVMRLAPSQYVLMLQEAELKEKDLDSEELFNADGSTRADLNAPDDRTVGNA